MHHFYWFYSKCSADVYLKIWSEKLGFRPPGSSCCTWYHCDFIWAKFPLQAELIIHITQPYQIKKKICYINFTFCSLWTSVQQNVITFEDGTIWHVYEQLRKGNQLTDFFHYTIYSAYTEKSPMKILLILFYDWF